MGAEPAHGHQLHWLQLGRGGMNEAATAREGEGERANSTEEGRGHGA